MATNHPHGDAVDRRAQELDTIAAALPLERRDELAELLTDQDVATLRHLVNEGMGENTLRASRLILPICRPGRWQRLANLYLGRHPKPCS